MPSPLIWKRLLKPSLQLRSHSHIGKMGVWMMLTIHDKEIAGKTGLYSKHGGRALTYMIEIEAVVKSIRHFSPQLPIGVMIDFTREEIPEIYDKIMEIADYVVKQTIPVMPRAAWGEWEKDSPVFLICDSTNSV